MPLQNGERSFYGLKIDKLKGFFFRAPTDCVQYFTGTSGSVKSYNFGGGQLLRTQIYNNCIRTEAGYCAIQWKESSTTSPDPFDVGTGTSIDATACDEFIFIPNLSPDGIAENSFSPVAAAFQGEVCGSNFGLEGMGTVASALVSKFHEVLYEIKFN